MSQKQRPPGFLLLHPVLLLVTFGLFWCLRQLDMARLDDLHLLRFEVDVAELQAAQGYRTQLTKAFHDFGVDVPAVCGSQRIAVQVKHTTSPVSGKAIAEALLGMTHYRCNACLVMTNTRFISSAIKAAALLHGSLEPSAMPCGSRSQGQASAGQARIEDLAACLPERQLAAQPPLFVQQGIPVALQPLHVLLGLLPQQALSVQLLLQCVHEQVRSRPAALHDQIAHLVAEADHPLPNPPAGAIRQGWLMAALAAGAHLGGEQDRVAQLHTGLRPGLAQAEPPVIRLQCLPAAGQLKVADTYGVLHLPLVLEAPESIHNATQAKNLTFQGVQG